MNQDLMAYRQWAGGQPGLPLFHQPWWLDRMGPGWKVALYRREKQIQGVWPYYVRRRSGMEQCVNPPFTPYLGPWIPWPPDSSPGQRSAWESRAVAALWARIPRNRYSLMGFCPGVYPLSLIQSRPWRGIWRQTYVLDLSQQEEKIREGMSVNLRRKLKKNWIGEILEPRDAWDTFWDFRSRALREKGVNPGEAPEHIQELWDEGRRRNQMQWLGAHDGNQWMALVWIAWDLHRAYYLGGARNPRVPEGNALSHLLWRAIQMARSRGQQIFDFEGSMDPGVERFFQSFGAQKQPYMVLHRPGPLWWETGRWIRGRFRF